MRGLKKKILEMEIVDEESWVVVGITMEIVDVETLEEGVEVFVERFSILKELCYCSSMFTAAFTF